MTLGDFGTGERGAGDRDLAGDLTEGGIGTGAGLFVRADRRGGGRVEGSGSAAGTGEDSLLRLGVGSIIEGAGVGRALLAAGDDLGAALGVDFVEARRYAALGSGLALATWRMTPSRPYVCANSGRRAISGLTHVPARRTMAGSLAEPLFPLRSYDSLTQTVSRRSSVSEAVGNAARNIVVRLMAPVSKRLRMKA